MVDLLPCLQGGKNSIRSNSQQLQGQHGIKLHVFITYVQELEQLRFQRSVQQCCTLLTSTDKPVVSKLSLAMPCVPAKMQHRQYWSPRGNMAGCYAESKLLWSTVVSLLKPSMLCSCEQATMANSSNDISEAKPDV